MRNQAGSSGLSVAVGGINGGLIELLPQLCQQAFGGGRGLRFVEFKYADELLEASRREAFDLFIVFLNPNFYYASADDAEGQLNDFGILDHLKSTYHKPVLVIHNGHAGYSPESIRKAGGDAVLSMPFAGRQFEAALKQCHSRPDKT